MKKLFTLCTAMLLAAMATAQTDETFQFVDANGNVVSDGSTIVVNQLNSEGQMVIPLWVKNVSGGKAAVSLYETIDELPSGTWQTCAFGNCMTLTESGYSPKNIVNESFNGNIETEWIPKTGSYATWEAKLQIHVFNTITKTMFGVTTEVAGTEVIGYGPTVTVRFEYKDATTTQDEQLWWGYIDNSNYRICLGTGKAETINQAIRIDAKNAIVQGNKIKAVKFYLRDLTILKDVKLWVSKTLPSSAEKADYVMPLDISTLKGGDEGNYYSGKLNEVVLSEPYAVSTTVYVGLTFTVTSVATDPGQYPIVLNYEDGVEGSSYLKTSSTSKWEDTSDYGPIAMEILVEGTFMDNAVTTTDFSEVVVALGETSYANLSITNMGKNGVKSFDYTITTLNSQENAQERHLDMPSEISKIGKATYVYLPIEADLEAGVSEKVLTITKVNGKPNEVKTGNTAQFTVTTVSEIVDRKVAVEEYTGTTCGYCPRGHVGMAKMRKEFGDKFVGIAIHRYANSTAQDAMYISSYNQVSFNSAPSCRLNRGDVIDPYSGSGFGILNDFRNELAIPAKVAVDVKGVWNEDSTKVQAKSTLRNVLPGSNYKIEYVLIADSLSGTTTAWQQVNYYNKAYGDYTDPSQLPEDLAFLVNTGEIFNNEYVAYYPTYNDVAIAVAKSTQTTAPGTLPLNENVENSYILSMPTNTTLLKAINKKNVFVIALVIDAATGRIANSAKSNIGTSTIGDVNGDGAVDVADISSVITIMADSSNDLKGDVNGDKAVDVADISAIISIMAGN